MRILPRKTAELGYAAIAAREKRARGSITPYLFILPYITFFVLFRFGPSLAGLGIAFTDWQAVKAPNWIGLANFQAMLRDPRLADARPLNVC